MTPAPRGAVPPAATGAGYLRPFEVEVVSVRPDGAGERIWVSVPTSAGTAAPGQFVLVPPGPEQPRMFSDGWWLTGAEEHPVHGARWEVATPALGWRPGDRLEVIGPMGRAFPVPRESVTCLVVGYETGQAPARWCAAVLGERGHRVSLALVARDSDHHRDLATTRRLADRVLVVDGLAPPGGDPWLQALTRMVVDEAADVLYAAGPTTLCRQAAEVAAAQGRVSQVTMYEPGSGLGCGIGLCQGCLITVTGAQQVRPCVVGPVLPGAVVLTTDRQAGR